MTGGEAWGRMSQSEHDAVCPKLSGSEWKAYTALANMRNSKTMETRPVGIALIMKKTGLPRRTAYRVLASLESKGLVEKTARGNLSSYRFVMSPMPFTDRATGGTKPAKDRATGGTIREL